MVDWRERILRDFTPQVARLTLVADPDGLLVEEGVLQRIRERGFELIPFDDHVTFRFAYESSFRMRWDRGEFTDVVVFLRSDLAMLDRLPYDLLCAGRRLSFSIGELFPELSSPVVAVLDRADLDAVAAAVCHNKSGTLGDNATKDFIRFDPATDRLRQVSGLLNALGPVLPGEHARHQEWLHFAMRWAELTAVILDAGSALPKVEREQYLKLRYRMNEAFARWLLVRYPGLPNQPPVPPIMLHHLPRMLARRLADSRVARYAMLVIDGLAFAQWVVIRQILSERRPRMLLREQALFAWIPTLTSVSRQSAFAGKLPLFFSASIHTTDKEPQHWAQFWADQGLSPSEVVYAKGLTDDGLEKLREELSRPEIRVAGLELGAAGMHNQVRQWASQDFLGEVLDLLFAAGFAVFLTSDHGNTEATGCGRPDEGACAEVKGERVRVYTSENQRAATNVKFPDAVAWPPTGLPIDYLPLLAASQKAFVSESARVVAHGGGSLEEVVVPLIELECQEA